MKTQMKTHIVTFTVGGVRRSCLVELPVQPDGRARLTEQQWHQVLASQFPNLQRGTTVSWG